MQTCDMQYFAFFLCSCLVSMTTVTAVNLSTHTKVVVLAFGGFRASFLTSLDHLKNLPYVHVVCAAPEYLKPVFPTKTPVNLFSVATGLYAQQHRVIDNCEFNEPTANRQHCKYEQYDGHLIPIWVENQQDGGISGVMRWPGSQRDYREEMPVYHILPDEVLDPPQDPVDVIIEWLTHKTKPANLVMAYFGELDQVLHKYGPMSNEAKEEFTRIDELIQNFIDKLQELGIKDEINLIILGSQGIHSATDDGGIELYNTLYNNDDYTNRIPFISMGTNAIVSPREDEFEDVYARLKQRAYVVKADQYNSKKKNTIKQYRVYKKDDMPDYWHLSELPLFDKNIFLVASLGYYFWNDYLHKILDPHAKSKKPFLVGLDGYSNNEESMRTIFMAMGPNFKPRERVGPFETIDVHPLLRELLGLKGFISDRQPEKNMNEMVRKLLSPLHVQLMNTIKKTLASCVRMIVPKIFGPYEEV